MRPLTGLAPFFVLLSACGPATTLAPTSTSIPPAATSILPTPTAHEMVHPTVTPGEAVPATAMPPPTELGAAPAQEVAVIEQLYDYYWPDPLILRRGLPTILYAAADGLEHVNRWTIGPFVDVSGMRPGQVFTFAFTPEEAGTFEIFNIGHNFAGRLLVAADCAEVDRLRSEQGVQAFALIHSPADGRLFPDRITVRLGLPVRLYHLSVSGDHEVSVETLAAQATIVRQNKIAQTEFTPTQVGEFAIRHADDALSGRLVVRESLCPET